MQLTNEKIKKVKPSETLAVKAKAAELKAQGKSIIDLSTGEPDNDTPEHIKEATIKALRDGKTKYTAVNGIIELREAIANKLNTENGIKCDAGSVIVTNGGKQAIYSVFDVTLSPGDEVVVPAPYWVSYPAMIEMCGGKPIIVKTKRENGLKITPDELAAVMNSKTKFVIINSPSNPTGVAYTKSEMRALAKVLENHPNCLILSDEVYEKLVFDSFEVVSFAKAAPDLADRVVTVNAFSKTYSMTGIRVGYAVGPKEIIAAIGRHQSQTTSNVCSIAQYGAIAAINGSHDFVSKMIYNFSHRIQLATEILGKTRNLSLQVKPNGAFYLFYGMAEFLTNPKNTSIKGSADFANFLLEQAGVAVVPGDAFGDDSAFRISVSSEDQNVVDGAERIVAALEKY